MAKAAARKGQKRRTRRKAPAKAVGMWRWYLALMLSVGAVVVYDHRAEILPMAPPVHTASIAKPRPVEKRAKIQMATVRSALALPTPGVRPVEQASLAIESGRSDRRQPGRFYFCTETFENCVVDGATFWFGGKKIAIAGIDAPEIKQAKCDDERRLGSLAKRRLWEILNSGEVRLALGDGASGLQVTVGEGRSVGNILVAEGLARQRTDGKRTWCAQG